MPDDSKRRPSKRKRASGRATNGDLPPARRRPSTAIKSAKPKAGQSGTASQAEGRRRNHAPRNGSTQGTRDMFDHAAVGERAVPQDAATAFSVVGIGASAGGLEALEQFFRHVPANSGLAFVIVQHLDPTHKGMMVELL
jgi:chemotaxis response regulator CheB